MSKITESDSSGSSKLMMVLTKVSYWRSIVLSQSCITTEVVQHQYAGEGTSTDPFRVEFLPNDPRNPMAWTTFRKIMLSIQTSLAMLVVAYCSSAYTGSIPRLVEEFECSEEVVLLGISLFVLGFALGPIFWAPLSELYGRQILFVGTYGAFTAITAATIASQNIQTVLVLRFLAGALGSSSSTNSGGVIADLWPAHQRGLAMCVFATAPFLGPGLGPITSGFLSERAGWRWNQGLMAISTGLVWVSTTLWMPETYAPVLLKRRAKALSTFSGRSYVSKLEAVKGTTTLGSALRTALSRPWLLLAKEPIVLILNVYMAVVYGVIYMFFASFPIVYTSQRQWSSDVGALPFAGIVVGMLIAPLFAKSENDRWRAVAAKSGGNFAPPEQRLRQAIYGSLLLPISLFWFAWTNGTNVHWIISILAGIPFGLGTVFVFMAIINYLVDAYVVYAASVLATNTILRSIFGAVFPLFTVPMYESLGVHWASSVPAFLALACVPFPLLFYIYGARIRDRCQYAKEAQNILSMMLGLRPDKY